MKKISPFILFFLCMLYLSPNAHAQDDEVFVTLGGGVSIPLGEYAATDFSDESSGFARVGGNFNIYFGYRFNEYFSIAGLLNGCVNRYDYVQVQEWFTENYAETLPNTAWVVESKNWGLGGLLAGPVGSIPIVTNRFFFDLRVLGGFLYAYSPAIYVTGVESGEPDKLLNIEQGSEVTWAIDAGAGFRYNRTRSQYFILLADYMYANPTFSNIGISSTEFEYRRADTYSQVISTINISIGIGYIIN